MDQSVTEAERCPIAATSPEDCDNPELVEPELDTDVRYFECPVCGYAWGWAQVGAEDECQAGVPEGVRRMASGAAPATFIGMPGARS